MESIWPLKSNSGPTRRKSKCFCRSSQPHAPADISNENRAESTLRGFRYNCITWGYSQGWGGKVGRWEGGNKVVISSLPLFYGPSCGQILHCSHWQSPSLVGNLSQPEIREGDNKVKQPGATRGREKGMGLEWTINLKTFVFSAAYLYYKIHIVSSFLNTNILALFGLTNGKDLCPCCNNHHDIDFCLK